ncbi:Serine/threonine-protein kinase/endoribonuclease IRE2 like [Verticillium longisporum]|nr:Serine/threonine-protein kinase/endoribonuclease IRE2 like [Verticillium longisporum]KAG7151616.1 Serine/threonine-protein kinase/endoribonuclease IRE2 like [Verticillium longisporum]
MAPQITSWTDFAYTSEEFDPATDEFLHTAFAVVDVDDVIHYNKLPIRRAEVSLPHVTSTLKPISDSEIFPKWPYSHQSGTKQLTQAPSTLPTNGQVFIKRPNLSQYDVFKRHNAVHLLARGLLEEARTMELLSQHPHPNIIRYHGCRSRRGYLTGIVLDHYSHNLKDYLKNGTGTLNKKMFMNALESAFHHLHSLGWAHNDLNPTNVLVDDSEAGGGLPVLIDFGSAQEVGGLLGTSRGTSGWIEGRIEDYTTSRKEHDVFALEKIRVWLNNPTFDDTS